VSARTPRQSGPRHDVMLPVLAATARRQGSQLAAKNSANSTLSWLTPINPSGAGNAYLDR
jgi:hypothetical protein